VKYDDNDQYAVGPSGEEAFVSMAAFEKALADDDTDDTDDDTVVVSSYDPDNSSDVARFVLTVVSTTS